MKTIRFIATLIMCFLISNCAVLRPPSIVKNEALENYRFIYISPTKSLSSSSGATIGGQYYSSGRSVNPSDVITGILTKEGFIALPELRLELTDQTMIINYGESGRRFVAGGLGGYTIEVTIQFISAKSLTLICSCTAEGQGSTEADDIREAITRCLSGVLSK